MGYCLLSKTSAQFKDFCSIKAKVLHLPKTQSYSMTAQEAQKLLGIRDDQILLLKAALYPTEVALHFWQQWKTYNSLSGETAEGRPNPLSGGVAEGGGGPFSKIDPDSQRILPLIYRNLEHTNDPLLPALKEVYRHTWMRNQRLLQKAQQVVQACNEAGIPNMLLKGIPMSLHYYKDMGVRPMGDVDLLVPYEYLDRAVEVLKTLGNTPNPTEYKYRHLLHAMHCYDKDGIDVDLHWFVHYCNMNPIKDNIYWSKNLLMKNYITMKGLYPIHHLFHTVLHGFKWDNHPATIRWVVDSVLIYKVFGTRKNELTELIELGEKFNVSLALKASLLFLHYHFQCFNNENTIIQGIKEGLIQKKYLKIAQYSPRHIFFRAIQSTWRDCLAFTLFSYEDRFTFLAWIWQRSKYKYEAQKYKITI